MKAKVTLVVIVAAAVVLLGALFQTYKLMETAPQEEVQVMKRTVEVLKGAAPSFVYGQFADMVNSAANAAFAESNLADLKELLIYENRCPSETKTRLVRNLKLDSRADEFVIVNGKGKVLLRSNSPQAGDSIIGMPIVRRLLEGKISGDTMEIAGVPKFVAGVPITDEKGTVIGGVVFCYRLDSKSLLNAWDQALNAHVLFVWKGKIAGSSFAPLVKKLEDYVKQKPFANAFRLKPPKGQIVNLKRGARVVAFGLPGQLSGKGGFVVAPKELYEFSGVDIFKVSQWLMAAAILAILIAILGSFWAVHGYNKDQKILIERVKQAAAQRDASIIQPQAFSKELSVLAQSFREALAAVIAASEKRRRTSDALELPEELKELAAQEELRAAAGQPQPPQQPPEVSPPAQPSENSTVRRRLSELVESALVGDAQQPAQQPPQQPEPPAAPAQAAADADAAETSDLMKLVEQLQQEQQQPSQPRPQPQPTQPPRQPSREEQVKVTLHGGPGGIPAIKPEEVAQMTEEDRIRQHFEQVFAEYVALRKKLGEPVDKLSKEKFFANLAQNRKRIMQKFKCKDVRFSVTEKNGKATVKATPVK